MEETSLYGFTNILKEYSGYPSWLPMPCHYEHGWTPLSEANGSDLRATNTLMLVFSKRRYDAWKEKSTVPVVIMGAPFVHYRRRRNITKSEDAKGTVAFPSHSTEVIDAVFDIDEYCNQLKQLPSEFQPITICLHGDDFLHHKDILYKKHGFNVVTAGSKFVGDLSFVEKFYNILKEHKYSTSNQVGSYSFYAVEMGISFFLLGKPAVYHNSGDTSVLPRIFSLNDYKYGKEAMEMFPGPSTQITDKQKLYVESELGINDCLSPRELNRLLTRTYLDKVLFPQIKESTFIFFKTKIFYRVPFARFFWQTIKKRVLHKKL